MATAKIMKNIQKQSEKYFYKVHTSPSAQRVVIGGIDARHKKGLSEQVTTQNQFSVQFIKKENICDNCKQVIYSEIEELWQNYTELQTQNERLRDELISLKEIIHESQKESISRLKQRTQTSESSEDKFITKKQSSLQIDSKDLIIAQPSDKILDLGIGRLEQQGSKIKSYQNSPNLFAAKHIRGLQSMKFTQSPETQAKLAPFIHQKLNYHMAFGSLDHKLQTQAIW